MIISDAAGFRADGDQITPVFFQDYEAYLHTLKRLSSYPTQLVGVAHGDIAVGSSAVADFYLESLSAAQQAHEMIKNKLAEGVPAEVLATEMFDQYIKGPLAYYPPEMMLGSMHLLIQNVK